MPSFDYIKPSVGRDVGEIKTKPYDIKGEVTFRDVLPYLDEEMAKAVPKGILATLVTGPLKGIGTTLNNLGQLAIKGFAPGFQKPYEESIKPTLDKLLKPKVEEIPGMIVEQIGEVALGVGLMNKAIVSAPSIIRFAAHYPKIYNLMRPARYGTVGTILGQVRMPSDAQWQERVKQAAIDFGSWTAWGTVGGIPKKAWYAYMPAYATIGYTSSRLEGNGNEEALTAGLMSAALGSFFHWTGKGVPKSAQQVLRDDAAKVLRKYSIETQKDFYGFAHSYHPNIIEGRIAQGKSSISLKEAEKVFSQVNSAWQVRTQSPDQWSKSVMQELNSLWKSITNRPIPLKRSLTVMPQGVPSAAVVPGGVKVPTKTGVISPFARERYGTVKEWGTHNQYVENNPFRPQLDAMKNTGKYDMNVLKDAERWEMNQVLKDKPAFLSENLSRVEISKFAKDNKLWLRTVRGTKDIVVAQNIDALNRTLNAIDAGNQRELGLSLGYKDLGMPKPVVSQITKPATKPAGQVAAKEGVIPQELETAIAKAKVKGLSAEEFAKDNDLVFQGVAKNAATEFFAMDIEGARAWAKAPRLKGTGEIRIAKFSDLDPEARTFYRETADQIFPEKVIEEMEVKNLFDRPLNKKEYADISGEITDNNARIIATLGVNQQLTDIYNQATKTAVKPVTPIESSPEFLKTSLNVEKTETPKNISELSNEWKIATKGKDAKKITELANQWKKVLDVEDAKGEKVKTGIIARAGKGFYNYIRPHFTIPPDEVIKGLKTLGEEVFISDKKIFSKMGKSGKELGRLFGEKETGSKIAADGMAMDMEKAGLKDLTKKEEWSVIAMIEGLEKVPVDNERVRKIAELWQKQQKVINKAAGGLDIMMTGAEGAVASYSPRENYFVHMTRFSLLADNKKYQKEVRDFGVATGVFKDAKEAGDFINSYVDYMKPRSTNKDFINKLAVMNNKTPAAMESLWRRIMSPNVPKKFGPLEKIRKLNFPLYDPRLKMVLPEFYHSLWERIKHIEHFGQNDEKARDLINKMGEDGYDWTFANRVFDIAVGKGNVDPRLTKAIQPLADLQTLKLVTAALLQTTQFTAEVVAGGWKNMIKGVANTFTKAGKEDVLRAGVALNKTYYEAVSGFDNRGVGSRITKTFGLDVMDKWMRMFAGNAGPHVLEDALKNPFNKFNKTRLLDLLITPERVARVMDKGITPEDIKIAQNRFAKITQYTYRPEDLPPAWRDSFWGKLVTMFKSFGIQHLEFLEKYAFKNPKRIPSWLLATIAFVAPVATVRRIIKGRDITIGGVLKDTFALALLGIYSEMIEAVQYAGGITHWAAGPLFGDISSGLEGVVKLDAKGLTELAAPYVTGAVFPPEVAATLNLLYQPIKKRFIFPYAGQGPQGMPSLR